MHIYIYIQHLKYLKQEHVTETVRGKLETKEQFSTYHLEYILEIKSGNDKMILSIIQNRKFEDILSTGICGMIVYEKA